MYKAVLMLVTLFALSGFAQETQTQNPPAAPANPPAGRHARYGAMRPRSIDERMAEMTRRYNLTEEQQQKLRPMLEQEMQQARSIRTDKSLTPEQKKQKLAEMHKQMHTQMQSVLTPEQRTMGGSRGGGNGRAMAWLDKKVTLTEEQKTKLQPIFAEQQQQVRAIRQDTSLTPEQKKAKIRDVRQKTRGEIMAVLTPEQQQQLQNTRRPHSKAAAGSSR
jgi:protein CpxP